MPSKDDAKQPKWKQWYWPTLDSLEQSRAVARKCQGGWAFAVLILLGMAITYFWGKSLADLQTPETDVTSTLIGEGLEFLFVLFASYRIMIGRGWIVSWVLFALFLAEAALKVLDGGPSVGGWVAAYIFIGAAILSGARACWDIRSRVNDGEIDA